MELRRNRKKSMLTRVDTDLIEELRKIKPIRVKNGLAGTKPQELSDREMTELLRKTNGFKFSMEELKNKPKKMRAI